MKSRDKKDDASGGIVILTALMSFALIAMVALVIDLGRLQFLKRQLQNAADAAALAGVNQLRQHSPPYVRVDEWQIVKKAVMLALSRSSIGELSDLGREQLEQDPANNGVIFGAQGQGQETCHDLDFYRGDSGAADNLSISIKRGVFCYFDDEGVPKRRWCALEGSLQTYCMANAVEVELSLSDVSASFARIFGLADLIDMTAVATAFMDPDPDNIEPNCSGFSDGAGLQVSVDANCTITWTQGCKPAIDIDSNAVCVSANSSLCAAPFFNGSALSCLAGPNGCSLVWLDEQWQCRAPCARVDEDPVSGCSPTNCPFFNLDCSKG